MQVKAFALPDAADVRWGKVQFRIRRRHHCFIFFPVQGRPHQGNELFRKGLEVRPFCQRCDRVSRHPNPTAPHVGFADCLCCHEGGSHRANNVERLEDRVVRVFDDRDNLGPFHFSARCTITFRSDADTLSQRIREREKPGRR